MFACASNQDGFSIFLAAVLALPFSYVAVHSREILSFGLEARDSSSFGEDFSRGVLEVSTCKKPEAEVDGSLVHWFEVK